MTSTTDSIQLPPPAVTGGMPLMEALAARRSSREFSAEALDLQTLSNLLWAAWGFNREHKRTAPTSHNRQDIDLYVITHEGTYLYDARDNRLVVVTDEDLSSFSGSQEFVTTAPLNIAIVSDTSKITGKTPQGVIEAIYANTGFVSQNIYLFCASENLATVTRAMVDKPLLAEKLSLSPTQVITLVQSVGRKPEK